MNKIAIGLPTNRLIKPKMGNSLMNLVAQSKVELHFIVSTRGYTTAENRNFISSKAVKAGCTHLFFVDDDMIYEPDTLDRLLLCEKDIVGGMYMTKYEKQEPVMEYLDDKRPTELFECGAMGGGLLLVKIEVLKKIPQPWFGYDWYDNGMIKNSNDWWFCYKARDNGFKIWCSPTIRAKHIGLYEY